MAVREPMPEQVSQSEYAGNIRSNTTPPVPHFSDLKPKDQAKLIKLTGQDSDPAAPITLRAQAGQTGKKPRPPASRTFR